MFTSSVPVVALCVDTFCPSCSVHSQVLSQLLHCVDTFCPSCSVCSQVLSQFCVFTSSAPLLHCVLTRSVPVVLCVHKFCPSCCCTVLTCCDVCAQEEALRRSESYFHARSSLALLAEAIQHRQQECPSPASPTPIFITPPRSSKKVSPTTSTRQ